MPERPIQTLRRGPYLVLPVLIRKVRFICALRVDLSSRALCLYSLLNRIDRRRQCYQLWSFVFHGFHLLSSMIFAFQLLAN